MTIIGRILDKFGFVFTGLANIVLLSCCALHAQSVVIYPGSAGDAGYSAGTTAYTIPQFIPLPTLPPGTQSTLRYGINGASFTYTLQVPIAGVYAVLLGFVEPCSTAATCDRWTPRPGQRVFSVWANDQPILQNLDVYAEVGALTPLVKAALLYIPGSLTLTFTASVRNAMVSLISVTNLGLSVAWCTGNPGCTGMGLTTLAAKSGQPTQYFLIPVGSPFLYATDFK